MSRASRLAAELATHDPRDEREATSLAATLERLSRAPDPFDEEADVTHVTASAFVVSRRGLLLHRHRRLGIWVQPGGHVDAGEEPAEAAAREVHEETGLWARHLEPVSLYQVDVHPGPRGHTHCDVRYLMVADPIDPRPGPEESPEVAWYDFAAAAERAEGTLGAVIGRLGREVESLVGGWSDG